MSDYIIIGVVIVVATYLVSAFLFGILLRGFAPFIPSRPWVIAQILSELSLSSEKPHCIALSSGRSGFFYALEKKYPKGTYIGVESKILPFLIARLQVVLRRTKIKVIFSPLHHVDYKNADLVYSHLKPDVMRGLGRKLKFECKSRALIISTGFNFPNLTAFKVVPLPDPKGGLNWMSGNIKIGRGKEGFKKEKKAFFYEI